MKRLLLLVALLEVVLFAQEPLADLPQVTIRASTHMVVVDVIVSDKAGNPVIGLQPSDFSVTEDGKAQKIEAFRFEGPVPIENHSPAPLPAHVYTNRTAYKAPAGPLTIIVLDGVNTALRDQMYARIQLVKYLETQLRPDQRIAVFALTGQLHLLQDFTSDPTLLLKNVEHFLAQDPSGLRIEDEAMQPEKRYISTMRSDPTLMQYPRFQEMLLERGAVAYGARVAETLSAFRTIAGTVDNYPGRKKLIWISSSFPLVFVADSSLSLNGAQRIFVDSNVHADARLTARRLAQAQIAVYPVDPRGLVGAAIEDASRNLTDAMGNVYAAGDFADQLQRKSSVLSGQGTMEDFANETGGIAYMNQNEISKAVALSAADGSSYYTLAYYPTNKDWSEKFRNITVKVARPNTRLRYRRGYYATDSARGKAIAEADLTASLQGEFVGETSVIFDARVIPPAPGATVNVPVEFLVNTNTLSYEPGPNGTRHYMLDFHVSAFASDGKVAAHLDKTFNATATAAENESLLQRGLPLKAALDLPAGTYRMRLIVRDGRTGLLGSLELPLVLDQTEAKK